MDNSNEKTFELLARLDERTMSIQHDLNNIRTDISGIKVELKEKTVQLEEAIRKNRDTLDESLDDNRAEIQKIYDAFKLTIDKDFVRKESFLPVQKIVYGLVGLVMSAIVVALLGIVIIK